MRIEAKVYPVNAGSIKANTVITLDGKVELKGKLVDGRNGVFHSWKGTEKYTKKDGTQGYSSPVFITDKELNTQIQNVVMAKFNGGAEAPTEAPAPAVDNTFASDDIPF
jgi:DNA-binding cell septation regulator SpoVG